MRIDVLSIFPSIFTPLEVSVVARARESGNFILRIHDTRNFASDERRTVDDRPYGGGPGMVMKPEPIVKAVENIRAESGSEPKTIVMSPGGARFSQEKARALADEKHIAIICGRYEGIDERVIELLWAEEISIGDYILCGGEIPAMAVIESVVRLLPGVLGAEDSIREESFIEKLLEYPQYTRPESFRGLRVPRILLSGDHEKIRKWRKKQAEKKTAEKRPDLYGKNE